MKANHNVDASKVHSVHVEANIRTSKIESKSQPAYWTALSGLRWSKYQNVKDWKQITTANGYIHWASTLKQISERQRLKANHNQLLPQPYKLQVEANIRTSKIESKSQQCRSPLVFFCCWSKYQNVKDWKQITTVGIINEERNGWSKYQNVKDWKQITTRRHNCNGVAMLKQISERQRLKANHNPFLLMQKSLLVEANIRTSKIESKSQPTIQVNVSMHVEANIRTSKIESKSQQQFRFTFQCFSWSKYQNVKDWKQITTGSYKNFRKEGWSKYQNVKDWKQITTGIDFNTFTKSWSKYQNVKDWKQITTHLNGHRFTDGWSKYQNVKDWKQITTFFLQLPALVGWSKYQNVKDWKQITTLYCGNTGRVKLKQISERQRLKANHNANCFIFWQYRVEANIRTSKIESKSQPFHWVYISL